MKANDDELASNRLRIMIPTIPLNTGAGGLAEFWSRPADAAALEQDRGVSPLEWAAKKAGLRCIDNINAAARAVQDIDLKPPRWALWQRLRRQPAFDPLKRALVHGGEELTDDLSDSAELGLALALALPLIDPRHRLVFATGALSDERTAAPTMARPQAVRLVDKVPEKLRLVIGLPAETLDPYRGPKGELLFFTPSHYLPANGEQRPVQDLPEVALLARRKVRVVPVKRLVEALHVLGVRTLGLTAADRALLAGLSLGTLAVLSAAVWSYWLAAKIPLRLLPGGVQAPAAEPYLACNWGERTVPVTLPRATKDVAILPSHGLLGLSLTVDHPIDTWLMGWLPSHEYYLGFGLLCEKVEPMLKTTDENGTPLRLRPGAASTWEAGWSEDCFEAAGKTGLLVIIASRRPIERDMLQKIADEAFEAKKKDGQDWQGWSLDHVKEALPRAFSGFLSRPLRIAAEPPDPCASWPPVSRVADSAGCEALEIRQETVDEKTLRIGWAAPGDPGQRLYAWGSGTRDPCLPPRTGNLRATIAATPPDWLELPGFFHSQRTLCVATAGDTDPALIALGPGVQAPRIAAVQAESSSVTRSDLISLRPGKPKIVALEQEPAAAGGQAPMVLCRARPGAAGP